MNCMHLDVFSLVTSLVLASGDTKTVLLYFTELTVMRREGRNMSSTPRKQYDEDIAHLHTKVFKHHNVLVIIVYKFM